MRIALAFLLPPLAVLLCGKPLQALLNLPLTLCFWIPGAIHALVIVFRYLQEQRTQKVLKRIKDAITVNRSEILIRRFRRRTRFTWKRMLFISLSLLTAYGLSIGPVQWLIQRGYISDSAANTILVAYTPLDWLMQCSIWFDRLMDWYQHLWLG